MVFGSHHLNIKENSKSMFLHPITENEVEKVARSRKNKSLAGIDGNKSLAGIDGIPNYIVKECIELLKLALTNIQGVPGGM